MGSKHEGGPILSFWRGELREPVHPNHQKSLCLLLAITQHMDATIQREPMKLNQLPLLPVV